MTQRGRVGGYGYLATAVLTWGTFPVVVQTADAPVVLLVAMRTGFGALALGAFLLVAGRRDLVPGRKRALLATLGLLFAANSLLFFRALELLPGAAAVLIVYIFPVLLAILVPPVLGEKREQHVLPLALVGFAGLALMLVPHVAGGRALGAVFATGGALATTALIIGARRAMDEIPGPVVAFWQSAIGFVVLLPWAAVAGAGGAIPWGWGALIGVVHTALAGVLFFRALGRLPAQEVGVLRYLEPASALAFSWVITSVAPRPLEVAGGALIVGAGASLVGLANRGAR